MSEACEITDLPEAEENGDDVVYLEDEVQSLILLKSKASRTATLIGDNNSRFRAGDYDSVSQKSEEGMHENSVSKISLLLSREQRRQMRRESKSKALQKRLLDSESELPRNTNQIEEKEFLFNQKDLFGSIFQDEDQPSDSGQDSSEGRMKKSNLIGSTNLNVQSLSTTHDKEDLSAKSAQEFNVSSVTNVFNTDILNQVDGNDYTQKKCSHEHPSVKVHFTDAKILSKMEFAQNRSRQENEQTQQNFQDKNTSTHKNIHDFQPSKNKISSHMSKRKRNQKKKLLQDAFSRMKEDELILETARKASRKRKNPFSSEKQNINNTNSSKVGVKEAKSIVGYRPKHWDTHRSTHKPLMQFTRNKVVHALSQATKYSPLLATSLVKHGRQDYSNTKKLKKSTDYSIGTKCNHENDREKLCGSHTPIKLKKSNRDILDSRSTQELFRPSHLNKNLAEVLSFNPLLSEENNKEGSHKILRQNNSVDLNIIATEVSLNKSTLGKESASIISPLISKKNGSINNDYTNDNNSLKYRRQKQHVIRKGKGSKEGTLMKQFRSIRNHISANCIRLRSGSYSFGNSDINDPRNRAKLYIDISIINIESTPVPFTHGFMESNNGVFSMFLAYVHNLNQRDDKKKNWSNMAVSSKLKGGEVKRRTNPLSKSVEPLHNQQNLESRALHLDHGYGRSTTNVYSSGKKKFNPHFAWICFSASTLHEQKIKKNSRLRIYDCVIINNTSLRHIPYDEKEAQVLHPDLLPTIVCTKLCEAYPSSLPPLKQVPPLSLSHK